MNAATPKQFLLLHGKPILQHTLERFHRYSSALNIIVVLPAGHIQHWQALCATHQCEVPHQLVAGGEQRFHSVKNGLAVIDEEGIVGIHDGVRPLVSIDTIRRVYRTAAEKGNAVPAIPINESTRVEVNHTNQAIDRSTLRLVQTPQCFQSQLLKTAFQQPYSANFTDDASVVEAAGTAIQLVPGNRENIKVTTPEDLKIAAALLSE